MNIWTRPPELVHRGKRRDKDLDPRMHLLLVEMKSSSNRGNVGGGAAAATASKQVVNLVEERERGMLPFCVCVW